MTPTIEYQARVHLLPAWTGPAVLAGGVAVVIDQLRASTTIATALAGGAAAVRVCEEPPEAVALAADMSPGTFLLGGERGGVRIDGFDLGNSPAEYTPQRVAGRTILFTTTNGTRTALLARAAERVLFGCLTNTRAVAAELHADGRTPHLLCAGTNGQISMEDVLAAGAILDAMHATPDDDAARIALELWRSARAEPGGVRRVLHASRGGRGLDVLGFHADVDRCDGSAELDVIPEMDRRSRRIIDAIRDRR